MNYNSLLISLAQNQSQNITDGIKFTTENLSTALLFMGIGMSGIFIGLFIIYLASLALQKIFSGKNDQ